VDTDAHECNKRMAANGDTTPFPVISNFVGYNAPSA
jgi:hypothetical protein